VQDAYVRAFRALGAFREEAALGTWLTRIVINEAQGRLRGRRETLPLTDLDDATMGEIIQFSIGATSADPELYAALGPPSESTGCDLRYWGVGWRRTWQATGLVSHWRCKGTIQLRR
jgi:Sigma-70 region 2